MRKILDQIRRDGKLQLFLALGIVTFLGTLGRWHITLSGDLQGVYYPLAHYFQTNHSIVNFSSLSIYPPGANLFFMFLPALSPQFYEIVFVIINCLFLYLIAYFTKRYSLLALIILCAGPILLLRFDVLVMLLVALAIITFRQNRFFLSGIFLGLATITKLFPVILVPYFLLVLFAGNRGKIWIWICSFLVPIILVFGTYVLISGQDWRTILLQANGAFTVSVHVESVMASLLTSITAVTNPGPHGLEFRNALWALNPLYFLGHARLFKIFSPLFTTIVYLVIFIKYFREKELKIGVCLLIILTLITTSQLLSPQYVIWPAVLILLLEKQDFQKRFWRNNIAFLILTLLITQLIYPLNYGEFLDFYNLGINPHLFIIMAARNLILVVLTLRLFKYNFLTSS